jgi:hypothetical protein
MTDWLLWIGIAMTVIGLAALAREDLLHLSRRRIRVEGEAVGRVALSYPEGRPDQARVGRPAWRAYAYAVLAVMLAILVARAAGWLGEGLPY